MRKMIKGISTLNPVDVEKEYLDFTVDYAIEHGFDHYQLIGPIHDGVKGNIDGMTFYKKYAQFNGEKDAEYVNMCLTVVNEALERLSGAGIKTYMWHHELDLAAGFSAAFPEALNEYGDVEVTHPLVRDYLENKIRDFFEAYPKMDGLILTLHETKVPLLKLKNQKLDKIERVKYVTEILYLTCKALGKELIVRPFASIEEDYAMMTKAYEEISSELIIMDKWTQFDWSLCLPHNRFYAKIKKNPLFVETDIFGEFFGKGRLPLMLKNHIMEKFAYCEGYSPVGYVSRIDRAGRDPFGEVNEVNLAIMHAVMSGEDVDAKILEFFKKNYGEAAEELASIMEPTEDILKKIIYLKGYYYSQLSLFPMLNHSKNHFYFEMMKDEYSIVSGEWFIPPSWERGSLDSVIEEKASAVRESEALLSRLVAIKDKIPTEKYTNVYNKFKNLELAAKIWKTLTDVFYNYAKFFELSDDAYKTRFYASTSELSRLNEEGKSALGDDFYCISGDSLAGAGRYELVDMFVRDVTESFECECECDKALCAEGLYDYVLAGGGTEGHGLKKEVNFSDTLIRDGELCRIPGNLRGAEWSLINAHGWFSYEVKVRPGRENKITVKFGSFTKQLDVKVTIGEVSEEISEPIEGKRELTFSYKAGKERSVRIRFDKISGNTPCVYAVKVSN